MYSSLVVVSNGGSEGDGGIVNTNSSSKFVNVTVISNTGDAGVKNIGSSLIFINCAIVQLSTTQQSLAVFLIYDNAPAVPPGAPIQPSVDPLFADPERGDYRLQACSPAINKGSNTYYAADQTPDISAINQDLAGQPHFFANGKVDQGAFEYQGDNSNSTSALRYGPGWRSQRHSDNTNIFRQELASAAIKARWMAAPQFSFPMLAPMLSNARFFNWPKQRTDKEHIR